MARARGGPIGGLALQAAVLAALALPAGLGAVGWAAGAACGVGLCFATARGARRAGVGGFGPADWVTLTRGTLVGGVAALTAESYTGQPPHPGLVAAIAVPALLLDWVDGQVARRTGTATGFGARFDMEVDALLILVLSWYVAPTAGGWVLAMGGMRYGYVVAGWLLPWLPGPLPPRLWRKAVAATQGVTLAVAAAEVLPPWLARAALAVALALLIESFGRDVLWRWRRAAIHHRHEDAEQVTLTAARALTRSPTAAAGHRRGSRTDV